MSSPEATPTGANREVIIEAAIKALERDEVLLNSKEAALIIGCGDRWLRDGANHSGFPHHRLGRFLRFSLQDCREIKAMNREKAKPAELAKARRARTAAARKKSSGSAIKPADSELALAG
ncbi:DNA-binding protein [Streptomyces angustmyceticus]|uniref:Helix-turn-helix domain-containing protein n=1 Tax=Streptomyces angustmyceticus TaxID=285578 RepID=A0A5J4L4V2_9ACTN|nr:DNA-binding protein [Streptomyces angustmyceticus]UAL65651.1 DNA-binding protein [Streptomyces angustmyceticus]GES27824.1 hypothetical protein San01_03110 [Streptomyces angustmyceticus]